MYAEYARTTYAPCREAKGSISVDTSHTDTINVQYYLLLISSKSKVIPVEVNCLWIFRGGLGIMGCLLHPDPGQLKSGINMDHLL
jgi:hypothetical protein